eukprot:Skav227025  [mRNA]  locus=scaffold456:234228:235662:+ [translate_table: standard]
MKEGLNGETAKSSALGKARPLRFLILSVAFLFVIFVLMASSTSLGVISEGLYGDQLEAMRAAAIAHDDHSDAHDDHSTSEHSDEHSEGSDSAHEAQTSTVDAHSADHSESTEAEHATRLH